ncbi:MAG: molybdopterin-binding protein [Firmicutes bacterium]|nr:molybdopterin-binding protein [Bacillota bacterium]
MKQIPVREAVGMVLCHDITQIIPRVIKGPAFKKGHIIQSEDIPILLEMGKEHIYVWETREGRVHENEAAERLARAAAGEGITFSAPNEGKVTLTASRGGLLKINTPALIKINSIDQVIFSTRHTDQVVGEGKAVAGTRVIPLVIDEEKIRKAEEICQKAFPLIEVKPLKRIKVGLVTTGSEVYHGRIKDGFGPVVARKVEALGSRVMRQILVSDDVDMIVEAIKDLLGEGADMIAVTGGMSVDPDDRTPAGVKAAGGRIVAYGAPTLPGSMFMLAYIGKTPVLGLPGCVMYSRTSIFDLVLPRLLAGEKVTRRDIVKLGHGGMCVDCQDCRFPDCSFGKN